MCYYTDNFIKSPFSKNDMALGHAEQNLLARRRAEEERLLQEIEKEEANRHKTYVAYKDKQIKRKGCLIDNFHKEQAKLPLNRRQNLCLISCPCDGCKPGTL